MDNEPEDKPAGPSREETIARRLCADAGDDPDTMVHPGGVRGINTPMGPVATVSGAPSPLWHFWVPVVAAALAAIEPPAASA